MAAGVGPSAAPARGGLSAAVFLVSLTSTTLFVVVSMLYANSMPLACSLTCAPPCLLLLLVYIIAFRETDLEARLSKKIRESSALQKARSVLAMAGETGQTDKVRSEFGSCSLAPN